MNPNTEVRDAVIKLETQMEQMSSSMASMASSVEKLADLRYELKEMSRECTILNSRVAKAEAQLEDLEDKQNELEHTTAKNSYVIGKIELFWGALITGAAGFFWYMLK
jgi:chromosome segregation ATPase